MSPLSKSPAGISVGLFVCFDAVAIGLPDGNGLDLMRQLSSRHSVKGIALSRYGTEEDVRKSKDAGFAEHPTKPVDIRRLQAAVRQVLT